MSIEQKNADRYLLLEKLHHRLEGSLHSHTDILSLGLSLGHEPGYVVELANYLRINGYVEFTGNHFEVGITQYGLRAAIRSQLAA